MVALTQGRNTPQRMGDISSGLLAAAAVAFQGALLVRDAAGNILPGATAVGLVGVGRAEDYADNTSGAAGDLSVRFRAGTFRYANSSAADEVDITDIGSLCFVVDDQTVAATNGGATRSPAGIVADVDPQGVWVRFDEALTNAT